MVSADEAWPRWISCCKPGADMQIRTRRRGVILAMLAGTAAAWPRRGFAEHPGKPRRVGMLIGYAENDTETQARLAAFRQGLDHLGWAEGRNIHIDYRFAPAGPEQAQRFAKELTGLRPDILVGNS